MKKIKFALVGCGSIGKRHVAVIDADPHSEIVAICDIDETQCQNISNLYRGIPWFTSYTQMLEETDADVISIATPHTLHAEMAIEACNRGFHTLVEKPMALTVNDCIRMNEAAYKNEVKLWVVKQNRHNVPVRLVTEAIQGKRLGRILMVKCDILWNRYQGYYDDSPWRGKIAEEGGALFTQASHFIDLLVWWCGDVEKVSGYMETQNHQIETEDSGSAVIKFTSGAIGSLNWTTCVYNKNFEGSITIIGERGTVKIGGKYLNKMEYWEVEGFPLQEGIEYTDKPNAYGKYQGTSSNHDKVITSLIAQLNKKSFETVDGFEGMKSIVAIDKIYKALRKHEFTLVS
ncbi:MAG: Gfo/Idh/MocA family oxidoreductase [Bacteroidia bacterium]|nr:Gfo/Idh/MocA family oxidoreductase [Bacteroidia bacterium]